MSSYQVICIFFIVKYYVLSMLCESAIGVVRCV